MKSRVLHAPTSWFIVALLLVLSISGASRGAEPALADTVLPASPALDDYLRVALNRSPDVRRAYESWRAEAAQTGYAGTLPDPMLMFEYMVDPKQPRLGARQEIPWLGGLRAEKAMAAAAARAAYDRCEAARLAVIYRTTAAYYNYWNLSRQVALMRENLQLLTFWEEVVRTKYRAALASHPDVIKAQVELAAMDNQVHSLEDRLGPSRQQLLAELNLPAATELPVPAGVVPPAVTIDETTALASIDSANPDLRAMAAMVEQERAGVRAANAARYPGLTVGADYLFAGRSADPGMTGDGADTWVLSASVSLPLWLGKNQARSRAAEARERAAAYDLTESRNRLRTYAADVMYQYRDARRRVELYAGGLLPKAEEGLNAAYTAYQAGALDFLSLLDAQRQLLEFQLAHSEAVAAAAVRLAELEMLAGGRLTGETPATER